MSNVVTISGLPSGTTPLSGSEAVPVWQGGSTVQVPASALSVASLISPSGDATGAKDTAAFTALLATPGIIALSTGTYYITTNLVFTAMVIIRGAGSSDGGSGASTPITPTNGTNASTILQFGTATSSTLSGITLSAPGSVIEDCHISNASTTLATNGYGIQLNAAHGAQVNRCSTYGFYYSCYVLNSYYFSITYNKFFGAAVAGIALNSQLNPDGSDCSIHGNWLVAGSVNGATPTAGIAIYNGGGVKITANKTNGYPPSISNSQRWNNCILLQPGGGPAAGSTSSSGVILIGDNSIESCNAESILLDGSAASASVVSTVSGLTTGFTTTITVTNVSGSNPYAVNGTVGFTGFTTTTQMNGLQGTILAIGGSSGAWTFTVSINSSGFTAFGAGTGSVVTVFSWRGIGIVNNEVSSQGAGTGAAVAIKGSVNMNFGDITVGDNVCPYGVGSYVNAYSNCSNIKIGNFACGQIQAVAIVIGQGGGTNQQNSTVQNVTYDLNKITQRIPQNSTLLLDYTCTALDAHSQGNQLIIVSREIPQCFAATSITSGSISAGVATINFSSLTTAPTVGNTIIVSGATPSGLNGPNQITSATATSVTFNTAAVGAVSAAGSFLVGLYGINLAAYNASRIKCILSGQFEGYGGQVNVVERGLIANGSGTITANTIGTDYDSSGASKAAFGFNVATNNSCYITLAQSALAQTEYPAGVITIEMQGNISEIYRY